MMIDHSVFTKAVQNMSTRDTSKWFILAFYKLLHGLLCVGLFYLLCIFQIDILRREALLLVLLFILMLMPLTEVHDALNVGNERVSELVTSQIVCVFLTYSGMFVVFNLIHYLEADFLLWLVSFFVTLVVSVVWTIVGVKNIIGSIYQEMAVKRRVTC